VSLIPGKNLPLCVCRQCHSRGYCSLSSLYLVFWYVNRIAQQGIVFWLTLVDQHTVLVWFISCRSRKGSGRSTSSTAASGESRAAMPEPISTRRSVWRLSRNRSPPKWRFGPAPHLSKPENL
jgi:hypothetical protein